MFKYFRNLVSNPEHEYSCDQMQNIGLSELEEADTTTYVEKDMKLNVSLNHPLSNGVKGRKYSAMMVICSPKVDSGDERSDKLLKAIQQGNFPEVDSLLSGFTKEDLNEIMLSGEPLLHYLCFKKDIDAMKAVLFKGAEPNKENVYGLTPIFIAVKECWTEGVEILLSYGAEIDFAPNPVRESPIIMAVRKRDIPTAFILLESRVDLSVRDERNNSVLHIATANHSLPLIHELLERSTVVNDIFATNDNGDTPLHTLFSATKGLAADAEEDILGCLYQLLLHGADINAINSSSETPLYAASRMGQPNAVRALLEAGADPTVAATEGKTVLHAACKSGCPDTLNILFNTGKMDEFLFKADDNGLEPFHNAVYSYSTACCEVLLENGDHLTNTDSLGRSRCNLILRNMPSSKTFLRRILDYYIHIENEPEDPDFMVNLDFSVLLSRSRDDIDGSILSEFYDSDMESLLKHPLVESFLYLKWLKIRYYYYVNFLFYMIFLIIHTYFIIETYGMAMDWSQEHDTILTLKCILIFLLVIIIVPGLIHLFANAREYLMQIETYFKIVALSSASFLLFSRGYMVLNSEIEKNLAAVSVFFSWVEFMMLLGRFPSLGVYIFMFTRVAKSILKFLAAFSSLLVAFALAFVILFANLPVFSSFQAGFAKTLMMMIGEIDYGEIYEGIMAEGLTTIIMSHIFLIVFLFLVPMLMANLLIGLAVNDLPDLQKQGKIRRLVKEAAYLVSFERILCVFKRFVCFRIRYFRLLLNKSSRVPRNVFLYPNRCTKQYKHRVKIPSEVLAKAISIALKETTSLDRNVLQLEDFQYTFFEICKTFAEDKKKMDKKLTELLNLLSKEDTITEDSVKKSPRNIASHKYIRKYSKNDYLKKL